MAAKKNENDKLTELLASFNEDIVGDNLSQALPNNSIKVERILLDLVRPDPVQPRRVLPERIHHAFHNNQLTPTQALREVTQIAKVASRQRGRPFSNILELLPDPERDDDNDAKLTPEEELLRDLVNLAVTIRDDGQVNPITVIDVTQGVTRLYRIETGERRYWAAWLLRDFMLGYDSDGMIDCIVVPVDRSSVFRQAKENTARKGLSAIAMARQAALLLLAVNDIETPDYPVTNDFYRQALDLRIPRGSAAEIYAAMGGIDKVYFSYIKKLLMLSDEAMELADRHHLEEKRLRPIVDLQAELHFEIIRQIIDFNLTARQVEQLVATGLEETTDTQENVSQADAYRVAKITRNTANTNASDIATALIKQEGNREMAKARAKSVTDLFSRVMELLDQD